MPGVLIGDQRNPEMEEMLSTTPEGTELRFLPDGGKLTDHLAGVEVLYGTIREADFQRAGDLKWVHQPFAGAEGHMYPAFKQSSIILTNCRGLFGPQISEHAFALLFSLTRRILDQHDFMKRKHWEIVPCVELAESTMGIVGLGGIGTAIASRAKAFGLEVLAVASALVAIYTFLVFRPARFAASSCRLSDETNRLAPHSSAQATCSASSARTGLASRTVMDEPTTDVVRLTMSASRTFSKRLRFTESY